MQQTKKLFLILSLGALLSVGLYFFLTREVSKSPSIVKPSQLDFTNSNQIQEPMSVQEQSQAEPVNANMKSESDSSEPVVLSVSEQKLWSNFEEILKSKNDNDPRVGELKNLSPEFRQALTRKYDSLKMEDRSARGFIVFLISKELKIAGDLDFLQSVYQEAPCLSLENCAVASRDDNPHTSGIDQTTMNYPQLVALYQLDKQLEVRPDLLTDPTLRAGILATLKQAEAFPVPSVHDRATQIRQKYNL